MKVRYIGDYYKVRFRKDKIYEVVEERGDEYKIVDETGEDYIFDKEDFEIVDDSDK